MRDLSSLTQQSFDLIIIGGGINGAGTAREAALQGLRTLLIDKGDFGCGTSSWSSRLIHGGLRYLEYFEFNLVRESLREREILLRSAPHLVRPIQMTIPIYRGNKRGPQLVRAGMMLYDLLSFDKTLPGHRMLRPAPFHQLYRGVNDQRLTGAAQYYDGQVEYAERLCWENILAAQEAGATVLNYVEVTALERGNQRKDQRITAIALQDCSPQTPQSPQALQSNPATVTLEVGPAIVVNTAGPWVDQVCQASVGSDRLIGGTKGSHIIVDPFPGAPESALYVEAESDGRPYFIIPWLGKYLIGTTDLRFTGDLDAVKASDAEIDYLIDETNRVLPNARLSRAAVRFTYAGVRPLPYSEGKKTSSITRSHIIYDHSQPEGGNVRNLISLVGGKLTTYRQVGDDLVKAVQQKLGRSVSIGKTKTLPLPGAVGLNSAAIAQAIEQYSHGGKISVQQIHHLFQLYGSRAQAVLALTQTDADLAQPILPDLPDILAQAVYAVRHEMAQNLVDIACRRTLIAMLAPNYGGDALAPICEVLQRHCHWSDEDCDRHIRDYHHYIKINAQPDYALSDPAAFHPARSGQPTPEQSLSRS